MKELEILLKKAQKEMSAENLIKFATDIVYELNIINAYIDKKIIRLKKLFEKYKE